MSSKNELLDLSQLEVKVEQREGIIQFKNFDQLKANVEQTLTKYDGLELDENNKSEIKSVKADLNRVKIALNESRIAVKKEYVKPLELFESQVKELVKLVDETTSSLDIEIKLAESKEKQDKEDKLRYYFIELAEFNNLMDDVVSFESIGLNITLSASENKLKEQIQSYINRVLLDLKEIESDQHRDRLYAKYVINKDLQAARIQLNNELKYETLIAEAKTAVDPVVEVVKKPVVAPVAEEVYPAVTLTLKNVTRAKILAVKKILEREGIDYE